MIDVAKIFVGTGGAVMVTIKTVLPTVVFAFGIWILCEVSFAIYASITTSDCFGRKSCNELCLGGC